MNDPRHKLHYFLCIYNVSTNISIYFTKSDVRWQDTSSQLLLSAFCSGPKLSSLQDIHFITKILLSSDKYYKHFQKSVDINFPNVYKVKLVYKLIQFANAVHFRSTIRMHPSFGTFHFIINIAL